jgi:DNA relaxase NicK
MTYGYCIDGDCNYSYEEDDLIDGYCSSCTDMRQEEAAFYEANYFDMYQEDYGQVLYGNNYN